MDEDHMEIVRFIGNDEECTHSIQTNLTTVHSSQGSHNKGSSKLTLKNFVDFNWDQCYYRGQLITLHISEKFIAYGFLKPDTSEGLVRIVNRETNERSLIKGFPSLIEDISFAHLYEILMLACIDQSGTVYVYVVNEEPYPSQKLKITQVFQINGDPSYCFKNKHLLSWCQHIPEQVNFLRELEFGPAYKGKILAVARGPEVEIWHIGIATQLTPGPVCANFDLNKAMNPNVLNKVKNAVIKINLNESEVVNISFSPDGSTISLALSNGSIFFYQISFEDLNEPSKSVFSWHPKEVFLCLRSLVFLDNRKHVDGDVELWKYAVTLSNQNEVLLWSCETWKCIQKIHFVRPYSKKNPMKLSVDGTGKYIFLSEIDNNLLYVMEVSVDNTSEKNTRIVCITEIMLQSPMLNMIIVDAKIDRNEVNLIDHNDGDNLNSLNKYSTIINLFAIQPKSIQEGQLIVSSSELYTLEKLVDNNKIEPTNIFPKPPNLEVMMDSLDLSKEIPKVKEFQTKTNDEPKQLSSMEVHNLVKEKLRLQGISIKQNTSNAKKSPSKMKNTLNNKHKAAVQPTNNFTYQQDMYNLNQTRECSPSNNEVEKMFANKQIPEKELQNDYQPIEAEGDKFEAINYSTEMKKEETSLYSNESAFNGSTISTIPVNKPETMNNGIVNQIDEIHSCLKEINTQLNFLSKKQKKIDNHMTSSLSINTSALCESLEPILMNIVQNANDQNQRKLQIMIDHQLNASQKKISDIIKNSNSNKIDTEEFTRSLVASLSPTLNTILKDLFLSTVIPKFEHACVTMFKQIDASFTERSLEYQNELKLLLNEEGNVNCKLEYAFDKFKNDMSSIIKHSEKKILCAQNDMQKQFSFLLKEKSMSQVELFVKDPENIATQYMILTELLDHGDYAVAFEKALSASNLDLVLFVCEKVLPEDLFIQPNSLKLPIVLSLIQQLSHDLNNNTELKYKYLDAAVGSLDYANDHHKENINLVLIKMDSNVEKFMQQYPYSPYYRKFKMLQLAVKTIISLNLN